MVVNLLDKFCGDMFHVNLQKLHVGRIEVQAQIQQRRYFPPETMRKPGEKNKVNRVLTTRFPFFGSLLAALAGPFDCIPLVFPCTILSTRRYDTGKGSALAGKKKNTREDW